MEKILMLIDDYWHPADVIEMGLRSWGDVPFEFDIVKTAKDILSPKRIAKYRAIINLKGNCINAANTQPWFEEGVTEVMPKQFIEYIENGGGFIAVHAGLAFGEDNNKDYLSMVGSHFITHPPRCITNYRITKPEHPIAAGLSDFGGRDEHYAIKLICDDADVFMESVSETGGTQVAGYTRNIGNGRLCAVTPGHTLDIWEDEGFKKLMTNVIKWCIKEL